MLVLALDTSTPSVTAGVVRLRRPHEIIAALQAGAARTAGAVGTAVAVGTAGAVGTPGAAGEAAAAGAASEAGAVGDPASAAAELLAERAVTDPFAHAERLMPLAREALSAAGHTVHDLDAVVVGLGPGPFTGLRVGIATAAALGDGLGIAVHGVPSQDAVARAHAPLAGPLLVVTDARRREVYLSAYRADGRRRLGPLVLAPADVPALLAAEGVKVTQITGAGATLLDAVRGPSFDPPVLAAGTTSISHGLVGAAAAALLTGAVPGPLTPLYLRRPDATEPGARKSVLGR